MHAHAVRAAVLAVITTLLIGPGAGTASAQRSWRVAWSAAHYLNLSGVSCPSSSQCVIVGGDGSRVVVLRTTNAGRSWRAVFSPAKNRLFSAVTCPTVSRCVLTGRVLPRADEPQGPQFQGRPVIMVSSDGGASFTQARILAAPYHTYVKPGAVRDISCPTALQCYAVTTLTGAFATGVYASADGGLTWRFQAVVSAMLPSALTCIDALRCLSVGVDYTFLRHSHSGLVHAPGGSAGTSDGWLPQRPPPPRPPKTTWDGYRGAVPSQTGPLNDVACLPTACYAVGLRPSPRAGAIVSTNVGRTWSRLSGATIGPGGNAISCPTATECVLGGDGLSQPGVPHARGYQGVIVTENAGASWSFERVPPRGADVGAVACAEASFCVATATGPIPNSRPEVLVRR